MPTTNALIQTRNTQPVQALHWLRMGWRDFLRVPWSGLAHGAAVALFALLLMQVAGDRFWFLAGAFSGFLIVAPVLAVGLYANSRALEAGQQASFARVLSTWWSWRGKPRHDWRLVCFGLLLGLAGSGWVLTSASLITLLSPQPVLEPMDFVRHVVLTRDHYLFELWLALGGVLAAPIFASSVVTLPLLLDRRIALLDAVLVSWQAVMNNPVTTAVWAGLIMLLTVLALASLLLKWLLVVPLVVVPVLGHASWHAYRALIDASALPLREGSQ